MTRMPSHPIWREVPQMALERTAKQSHAMVALEVEDWRARRQP